MFHNEALQVIDILLHPVVVAVGVNSPPASPAPGQCWIVGAAPGGAWSGQAGRIAGWGEGGWRFVEPIEGMMLWSHADQTWVRRAPDGWRTGEIVARRLLIGGVPVVGTRGPAIADPTGGATIDGAARAAITALLNAARAHGLIDA